MSTTTSVRKSDSECAASAIIAELCPTMPAINLNNVSNMLPMLPTSVTLYISRSRVKTYRLQLTIIPQFVEVEETGKGMGAREIATEGVEENRREPLDEW